VVVSGVETSADELEFYRKLIIEQGQQGKDLRRELNKGSDSTESKSDLQISGDFFLIDGVWVDCYGREVDPTRGESSRGGPESDRFVTSPVEYVFTFVWIKTKLCRCSQNLEWIMPRQPMPLRIAGGGNINICMLHNNPCSIDVQAKAKTVRNKNTAKSAATRTPTIVPAAKISGRSETSVEAERRFQANWDALGR